MSELEKTIERYLVKQVEDRNGMCLKFNSDSMRGVPDRIVIMRGITAFIEVKAPGKKPREEQARCFDKMTDAGAEVFVVDSKEQVDDMMFLFDDVNSQVETAVAMMEKEAGGLDS